MNGKKPENYLISTDKSLLDINVIYGFISNSYWANGVSREIIERSIANSLCFGMYENNRQIGFARVISDFATFGYLADVFILDSYQGRGLGEQLVSHIVNYPELRTLRRFLLGTRDAHGLYKQFGFEPLKNPETFMSIHRPDIYRTLNNS